jgi:hypothetical protein
VDRGRLRPDGFWKETPRSFVNAMEGAAERDRRAMDMVIAQAWWTESQRRRFEAEAAQALSRPDEAAKPQTGDEVFAVWQEHASPRARPDQDQAYRAGWEGAELMASSLIGSLRVALSLGTADFEAGANKAASIARGKAKEIESSFAGAKRRSPGCSPRSRLAC